MLLTITEADLAPFAPDLTGAKAAAMIADVMAVAKSVAPGLRGDLSEDDAAAAKAIVRRAILRWHERGLGGRTTVQATTGPFSQMTSTDQSVRGVFLPEEIDALRAVSDSALKVGGGRAFSVDLSGGRRDLSPFRVLPDGSMVDLRVRPDLWVEYGNPYTESGMPSVP